MAASDRRIRYTKQAIKDSLFELMQETPVEKITVKELCAAADINRATFYAHYDTLTALLEEIEVEKSRELFEALGALWVGETYFPNVLDDVLKYLKEHPVMRDIFLNTRVAGNGLALLLQGNENDSVNQWTRDGKVSRRQAQWIYLFLVSGMKEVLRQWFAGGMKEEALLKQTLIGIIETGLHGFVYTQEVPQ
ncbi:MAG: TetR/AcrR family transcriptional regulator [Oscillospiraceae bacterium]|nr:TetR/AcrR family transcriptional regulator [Oscillospiraceae bacterium]